MCFFSSLYRFTHLIVLSTRRAATSSNPPIVSVLCDYQRYCSLILVVVSSFVFPFLFVSLSIVAVDVLVGDHFSCMHKVHVGAYKTKQQQFTYDIDFFLVGAGNVLYTHIYISIIDRISQLRRVCLFASSV